MNFEELQDRALAVRKQFETFEKREHGRAWSSEELALGFVGDVGDLAKLVQAKNGVRQIDDLDDQLAHELADCLWSVMVLADAFDVDLENAFLETMTVLEQRLSLKA